MANRELYSGKPVDVVIDGARRWASYEIEKGGAVVKVSSAFGSMSGEVKAGDAKASAARLLEEMIRRPKR